jgi:hypothetical protein
MASHRSLRARGRVVRRTIVRERDGGSGVLFVAVGALAGLAVGVLLTQRYGGLGNLSSQVGRRVRDRFGPADANESEDTLGFRPHGHDTPEYDDEPLDEDDLDADEGEMLEERVLEAFRNDPVLSERAIDIGALGRGIIELTGWVHADDESTHAVTVTRGVPGVDTVVNRLVVREEEERMSASGEAYERGEAEVSPRWEGMGVGTGQPRQGTSQDVGRHADPKTPLEDKWQDEGKALRGAVEDIGEIRAERRQKQVDQLPADRTGGAPIAPSGVPKGDHVADPSSAEPVLREQTGRVDRNTRAD